MRGEEIMSGAQRVHEPEFLTERAKAHNIGKLNHYFPCHYFCLNKSLRNQYGDVDDRKIGLSTFEKKNWLYRAWGWIDIG